MSCFDLQSTDPLILDLTVTALAGPSTCLTHCWRLHYLALQPSAMQRQGLSLLAKLQAPLQGLAAVASQAAASSSARSMLPVTQLMTASSV